ncbi:MAG TPA: hypothetical protein PLL20_19630 [Phycisphaerae bacterium]|mgnify:CR=1 FL=1|nr:hypothetical protein [Phycisphaerae bacterium]HRR86271.1 hypothetical protein [Phycisphaerae bacterium]
MSLKYLLGALRFVRWFFLIAGSAALAMVLIEIGLEIPRLGFSLLHPLLPALLLVALFACYRLTEVLLLLSLNRVLCELYKRGGKMPDHDLSQRLRGEIARRERFHKILCGLRGVELSEILDRLYNGY